MIDKCYGDNEILINFYDGADGPTVRIDTRSMDCLVKLRGIFIELAETKVNEVELHEVTSVKTVGLKALSLRTAPEDREPERTLELVEERSEGAKFWWSRSADGWMECAELVDGILSFSRPGHQYLTQAGIDDALIVVAYLET